MDGRHKDSPRCLCVFQTKALNKAASKINWSVHDRALNKSGIKDALKEALCTRCNRRRNSAQVVAYRHLGVFMDPLVPKATLQPVVVASSASNSQGSPANGGDQGVSGFKIGLADDDPKSKTMMDAKAIAAASLGEFSAIDAWNASRSVCETPAPRIMQYAESDKVVMFLRPESEEQRKAFIETLRNELRDQALGDFNLSEEELD